MKLEIVTSNVSIPFEQGDVFRPIKSGLVVAALKSQSLSSRAMSFDKSDLTGSKFDMWSQSLSSRAMSFDVTATEDAVKGVVSQSLSSRAMSFDLDVLQRLK